VPCCGALSTGATRLAGTDLSLKFANYMVL
jgi:hypothetical protein